MDKKPQSTKTAGYKGFTEQTKASVLASYGSVVDSFGQVQRQGKINKTKAVTEVVTDVSIRAPFNRRDYEFFRPDEAIPRRFNDLVLACRCVYQRVGIIKNVIDLMTDFACEDLRIIDPNKTQEAFYRVWMKKTCIREAADEFVRHFLLDGNVIVKRLTAKLTKPVENQWMDKALASPDFKVNKELIPTLTREIPWRYTFLNVVSTCWLGGEAARLSGERQLGYKVCPEIVAMIKTPKDDIQKKIVEKLPVDVRESIIKSNDSFVKLDMSKLYIAHHKKDSWEDWAAPFLASVLSDIYFRDKLRQAEISALDGVINVIRLWKLGDHTQQILPDDGAVEKLINILAANSGGGAMDIVWDSMIEMQPFYPPVADILGSEKFDQVNRDILIGLGVPEVLIGGKGGNFSNSWIQLKTLIEKLSYVRSKLKAWLEEEVKLVADAMDFPSLPQIRFNEMNLQDENVARKLIVGLLDRGIVSVEAVLEAYGEDFLIETKRITNEDKVFKKLGIEVKSPFDQKEATGQMTGRPPASKDINRETRTPKPRTSAKELLVFAMDAVDLIDEEIIPLYLKNIGVANARKLTSEQKEEVNNVRILTLSSLTPKNIRYITIDELINITQEPNNINKKILNEIKKGIDTFINNNGKLPTLVQRKRIEAIAWCDFYKSN